MYEALNQSLRLYGRDKFQLRTPTITFGSELGWVECTFGKTRVIAHVEVKMVKPPRERPFGGMITIHSEISPMTSADYELGRPSEEEVTMTRMLDKVLRRSDAIDKNRFASSPGNVWHLCLTVHSLADAGNMLDCACLTGTVAFKHFRQPEVEVIGDDVVMHAPEERAPLPLASPYTILVGTMSIALNAQREICILHKAGGVPTAPDEILLLLNIAAGIAKDLDKLVEARLREDWAQRKVEVR
ncbi:ribosomal protein S5 domain 2-like protein [Imleria badia]|nr:ribosomal protein S5 domain 2-like protein [Imleria badia]